MIKVEHVYKRYANDVAALQDVSVNVNKGEFVFIVGQSGSGKSTFLRLLTKEEKPTSGHIWVAGKEVNKLPTWRVPALRRAVGSVFQDFKLLPNKTVKENVAFALEVIGQRRPLIQRMVPEVLRLVGLEDKVGRFPEELSGGEQQRVSIARAFVNRPLVLLCDEPTGNLDPQTSQEIMSLLDRINRTGTTIVMATHDHAMVDAWRKRVIQLEHGKVIRDEQQGTYVDLPPVRDDEIWAGYEGFDPQQQQHHHHQQQQPPQQPPPQHSQRHQPQQRHHGGRRGF